MKTMMLGILAVIGLAGQSASAQTEPQKKMDECCAKKEGDCCSSKPDNCCSQKMEGCCDKMKDECCTWSTVVEGKHTFRRLHCVEEEKVLLPPTTIRIEVKPEDRQPGDVAGYKTVGKHTERIYYRDVEMKPVAASDTGCACSTMYVTVGKHTERRDFCERGGRQMMCGERAAECSACNK